MNLHRLLIALALGLSIVLVAALLKPFTTYSFDRNYRNDAAKSLVSQVALALVSYHSDYGDYPSGTGAEIVSTLCGNNPRKITYLNLPAKSLNEKRELLDPWKTPLRIEFDSSSRPRISSAGKNTIFEGDAADSDDVCSWR